MTHEQLPRPSQPIDELFNLDYEQLRRLAHRVRTGWHGDPTLGTTVLIHEAYLRLARDRGRAWDRLHLIAVVSRAMRQVLMNYAERRLADKRGGTLRQTTLEGVHSTPKAIEDLLALDAALRQLERQSPRLMRVVECRFFGGLSVEETADATDTSPATVKRDWRLAQAYLRRAMAGTSGGSRGVPACR
jgi:RNA polymerase sigma factor (TIGR02999 family)